jgi:hypothetical protein
MIPTLGTSYTRRQIHNMLGGELDTYLPQRDGRIVCGCFVPTYGANPQAPREILVGDAPKVVEKARLLRRQSEPLPVFLKRDTNVWQYIGTYRLKGASEALSVLRRKEREAGREALVMVLYLEPVPTDG